MKNKILFSLFGFALALPLAFGAKSAKVNEVKADGHGTEAVAESIWHDQLPNFHGSATQNATTRVVRNTGAGKYIFEQEVSNVEIKGNYNFTSWSNSSCYSEIKLYATYSGTASSPFETSGYTFRIFQSGRNLLLKNGATLVSHSSGPVALDSENTFLFKTSAVSCSDGSVHLLWTIDGETIVDYYDTSDPITSGCVGGESLYTTYTVSGETIEATNLPDYSDAIDGTAPGANVPFDTIKDSGCYVKTTSSIVSGVGYYYSPKSNRFSFKTNVTKEQGSTVAFQIGAISGVFMKYNNYITQPQNIGGGGYYWDRAGYMFYFAGTHVFLASGYYDGNTITDAWLSSGLSVGTTYEIEYSVESYSFGNWIRLYVDGSRVFQYLHSESPLSFVTDGSVEYTYGVYTESTVATFEFERKTVYATGDEVVVGQRRSIDDSRIDGVKSVSYAVTNISGEAKVTDEGRLTAQKVGLVKSVVTVDGVAGTPQYFFITSGDGSVKDSEQTLAWANYFVNATRTDGVCLAPTDAERLEGLQALWPEFAASYSVLSTASKEEYCESDVVAIATSRNHYLHIISKFGASNLGEAGAFVTDGVNPLTGVESARVSNITANEGSSIVIVVVAITSVTLIGLLLITKKRRAGLGK